MLKCSPTAAAVCPYRGYCEPDAVYFEGSECDRFNDEVARFTAAMAEPDSLTAEKEVIE